MLKTIIKIAAVVSLMLLVQCSGKKEDKKEEYTYESVPNDPLNARIYTLKNGLKVYMTVFKDAPRIQTYIAVHAGSKNDPANATGLAHYLEHMVFKGTSRLGTVNWEKEKVELQKIKDLYQEYGATTDEAMRKNIYHRIDSISNVAATYAVANEYDKIMSVMGGKGINAYTSFDQTVYVSDIPSNQLERWVEIEAERFNEFVPRLFHTELEAVYEEKNRGLDNDFWKIYEQLYAMLFKKHTYGTQTTIGTIEHLKNPSLVEIEKYFNKYYVPNNMAICISGDFDPDAAIKAIDKYWGKKKAQEVTQPTFEPEAEITEPEIADVEGPNAEMLMMAYRFPSAKSKDALMLDIVANLLSNGSAGLMDLNLNQKLMVQGSQASVDKLNDYSVFSLYGMPKSGQKLEEVRTLMLGQIELVKQGKFEDWMLSAIINNLKIERMKIYEENASRADVLVNAFINGIEWKDQVSMLDDMSKVTKQEVVDFANKYFKNNYVCVNKRMGKNKPVKVEKPAITPVPVNRDTNSVYYKEIMAKTSPDMSPVFVDYKKELVNTTVGKLPMIYKKNDINQLFNLYYVYDIGKNNDPKYTLANNYMNYIGAGNFTAEDFKKEFFKIGCTFNTYTTDEQMFLMIEGLEENLDKAVTLFESMLETPKADEAALSDVVGSILKERADMKLQKEVILRMALANYAKYGPNSVFTNILSEKELKNIKAEELVSLIKGLKGMEHTVLYYGAKGADEAAAIIAKIHTTPEQLTPAPKAKDFPEMEMKETQVLWADYDMVQAEIQFISKSSLYSPAIVPQATLFNEYFGGNMGSLVFQELRESKALAYSVSSRYNISPNKDRSNYVVSYIGTQSDKLKEAMVGMQELLNAMPVSEATFKNAKESVLKTIETERITKSNVLTQHLKNQKQGIDYDIRKDIYEYVKTATIADVTKFNETYMKNQPQTIIVVGSKKRLDFKELSKYGKVKELKLKEIFGY